MPSALTILLAQFDQAYDHRSWHGPNLRGSLRGLTGGMVTVLELVTGIAAHDLYHAGQIQLLKRLMPGSI